MINLFLDCEFNSFQGELISIALVHRQGQFYRVINYSNYDIDPWVESNVLPVLGGEQVQRYQDVQQDLAAYLNEVDSLFGEITVIADWPDDIRYFQELLITGPGQMSSLVPDVINYRVDRKLSSEDSKVPHNALHDARAIHECYLVRKELNELSPVEHY